MAKYLLLYRGGSMPESDEARAAAMKAWDAWFHEIGSAVADGGNPFTPGVARSIAADGAVSDAGSNASGYSILEADSLDHATTLAKGCPVLQGGASIEVHEIFDVM